MVVGKLSGHAAARGSLDESLHDEVRLVHLLDGSGILADGCGNRSHAHRSAMKLVDDGGENLVVDLVQTILVDVERTERGLSNVVGNGAVALHLGEVAHTAQQRVGDTGRTA